MAKTKAKPKEEAKEPEYVDEEGVATRLKRLRLECGLSQRQLAEPGVTYAYISRIEAGARNPSVKAIRCLAEKLGVSASYLETGKESPGDRLGAVNDVELQTLLLVLEALQFKDEPTKLEKDVLTLIGEAEELRRPLALYRKLREAQKRKIAPLLRAIENYALASTTLAEAERELRSALEAARR